MPFGQESRVNAAKPVADSFHTFRPPPAKSLKARRELRSRKNARCFLRDVAPTAVACWPLMATGGCTAVSRTTHCESAPQPGFDGYQFGNLAKLAEIRPPGKEYW